MNKYEFALVLVEAAELTDEIADALYSAGCDDGAPGTASGRFVIEFARQSKSLEEAIASAIADVRRAGYNVEHVEIEAGAVSEAG